jgi:hypothetical protein
VLSGFPSGYYFLEIGEDLSGLDADMDAFFPFNAFISILLIQICCQFSRGFAELQHKCVLGTSKVTDMFKACWTISG